jgi:hypothetical protein
MWVIVFGLLVYLAITTQNPMLPFYDFGLTFMMIIVGSYGLAKQSPPWIMGFGLLYFFSALFSLGITIFQRGYRSPVLETVANGNSPPPPVLMISGTLLINAWILWVIHSYYKYLVKRNAQKTIT